MIGTRTKFNNKMSYFHFDDLREGAFFSFKNYGENTLFIKINDYSAFNINNDSWGLGLINVDKKLKEESVTPYVDVEIFTH